jgi:hypothetical protein
MFIKIDEFMRKQLNGLNKRHIKNKIHLLPKSNDKLSNIIEINSNHLISLFGRNKFHHDLHDMDVLVYYYNNWCGFCSLLNFNLMKMVKNHLKNVKTFKILK